MINTVSQFHWFLPLLEIGPQNRQFLARGVHRRHDTGVRW